MTGLLTVLVTGLVAGSWALVFSLIGVAAVLTLAGLVMLARSRRGGSR